MNGVGQDERARPRCHFRPNDCLAEAQFAEHGRHIDPTGETDDTENWLEAHGTHSLGHRSQSVFSLIIIDNSSVYTETFHTSAFIVCVDHMSVISQLH